MAPPQASAGTFLPRVGKTRRHWVERPGADALRTGRAAAAFSF